MSLPKEEETVAIIVEADTIAVDIIVVAAVEAIKTIKVEIMDQTNGLNHSNINRITMGLLLTTMEQIITTLLLLHI